MLGSIEIQKYFALLIFLRRTDFELLVFLKTRPPSIMQIILIKRFQEKNIVTLFFPYLLETLPSKKKFRCCIFSCDFEG